MSDNIPGMHGTGFCADLLRQSAEDQHEGRLLWSFPQNTKTTCAERLRILGLENVTSPAQVLIHKPVPDKTGFSAVSGTSRKAKGNVEFFIKLRVLR